MRSERELEALRKIGRICALARDAMAAAVEPGITTRELDDVGKRVLDGYGARSAPILDYKFPGVTCISINNEAAHGIPGDRKVKAGDLVNVDVSAELDGFYGDTGATVPVPPITAQMAKLCAVTRQALDDAIEIATAGRPIRLIGRAVERRAFKNGFTTIRNLSGHGVGRSIHEEPSGIPNYDDKNEVRRLKEGSVLTIEPFLTTGSRLATTGKDGWTLSCPPGILIAQYEHTMVITRGKPIILTAA